MQLWLLWLGVVDIDHDSQPGELLPSFVCDVVKDSFMMYDMRDRLTLTLGFTKLLQALMSTVGALLEEAIQDARDDRHKQRDDEGDEGSLMQMGLHEPQPSDWADLLHQMQQAFGHQTKSALKANTKLLQRMVHHRCVDVTKGRLLGLLQGKAGDLVALLAAMEAETADVDMESYLA